MNLSRGPGSFLTQTVASIDAHRHGLLLSCLLGASGNSLLFYFVHQPDYNHQVNLLAAAIFLVLMLAVPFRRAFTWVSNTALTTALALIVYIAAHTGGINSPAMVWVTIVAVPALLLLGRRWALYWVGLIVLATVALYMAVMLGWISGEVNHSAETVLWAFLDKVLVIISLMLAVNFYERMHQNQMHVIGQGNADLEATQKALRQAQSHKDEFIASVGHELRTPMNAILGLNGVLQTELAEQPENKELAEHIRQSTEQLLRLVNDILDFSQLEIGRLNLLEKPVHLADSLERTVRPYAQRAQEKSLQLQCHLDPALPTWVLADAPRMFQVLSNLLDNAIKFTRQGQIQVRVTQQHEAIYFEVQDTGRGILVERQKQVFKRFEHADVQTNRAYGGTGLGLAICERLVSLQKGRIGVSSRPGEGATFWYELPLVPAQAPPEAQAQPRSGGASPPLHFLLVDDNAVNLMVARLVINKCWPSASVSTAGSGEQALALLDAQDVDLVLMDMVMPGLDGMQTTQRLRAHVRRSVAQLPVIGLTANTNTRDRERCLQSGMNDVLAKPIDRQNLKEVVESLVRHTGSTPAQLARDSA